MYFKVVMIGTLTLFITQYAFAVQCQLRNIRTVNFRNYDPLSGNDDAANGRLTFRCRRAGSPVNTIVNYKISMSTGQSNSYLSRRMQNSNNTDEMNYNLYADSPHTQIWGNGSANTVTTNGKFTLNNNNWQSITPRIYGNIPADQNVSAGEYSDIITITVSY